MPDPIKGGDFFRRSIKRRRDRLREDNEIQIAMAIEIDQIQSGAVRDLFAELNSASLRVSEASIAMIAILEDLADLFDALGHIEDR